MLAVVEAILPLVLVTGFGTGLKAIGFLDGPRRAALETVVYFVLVPPLILRAMNRTAIELATLVPLAVIMLVPIAAVTALAFGMRAAATPATGWLHGPGFPSTVMGLTRNNIFLVFAASQALLGPDGAAITALAAMLYVPAVNIVGVVACMRYGTAPTTAVGDTLKALASNPFIAATAAGLALNLSGIGLPGPLAPAAGLLADSALGLALVCVGAGLTLPAVRTAPLGLVVTAVLKLLAMPVMAWALCVALAVEEVLALAVMLYHAGPTAPGAYVLARQLGGDAEYMAALITSQHIAAAVTMPLVFASLRALYL
ncbi:MAG: AEC family transporter [Alphaproteobacteria bacterium]